MAKISYLNLWMKRKNIIIGYFLGIVLLIFLIWAYSSNKHDLNLLKTKGAKTKGVIIKVVDKKRGLDFKYQYLVNCKTY